MEAYLRIDHFVYEDAECLTSADQIEDYFKDDYYEHFECGQGSYQDEADLIVKIGEKFYDVHLEAVVYGNKQDHGDRLYYVDHISEVTYKEIPKPLPKEIFTVGLEFSANQDIINQLQAWLKYREITDYRWGVTPGQVYTLPGVTKE